jgi:ATP-dependent RNA helicase DHX8/PRP22
MLLIILYNRICLENLILTYFFLAEFIIDLAYKNDTLETFKKALLNNGAEFSVSLLLFA